MCLQHAHVGESVVVDLKPVVLTKDSVHQVKQ